MEGIFQLVTELKPRGDQPQAIEKLVKGIKRGLKKQTLVGVTGSGKTFTMAHIIQETQKPTLVISHNKTLAAQLFSEFSSLFPNNHVEYFVSYYDYYQPEAYVPQSDTYIEKDASINDKIDRMRHSATRSLLEARDTVIVASVSCIYGLGSPRDYREMLLKIEMGEQLEREKILKKLVEIRYERNDVDFSRGKFRVRGDIIDIFPAYEKKAIRIELWGDEIKRISFFDPLTRNVETGLERVYIYPATHYLACLLYTSPSPRDRS